MAAKTSEAIDRELARAALEKRAAGKRPTTRELGALRRVEAEREERLRWEYYASVPAAHYRELAGCRAQEIKTLAAQFGLPIGGKEVNLREAIRGLHEALAGVTPKSVGSIQAVAEHFDTAASTVKEWIRKGLPRTESRSGKRVSYRYDLEAVAKWRAENLQPYQRETEPTTGEGPRNRLDRVRAEKLEFQLGKSRGEVVEVDPVRRLVERRINEAKAILGQLPDRIAAEMAGLVEQEAIDRAHEIVGQQTAAAYRSLADMARAEEVGGDVGEDRRLKIED